MKVKSASKSHPSVKSCLSIKSSVKSGPPLIIRRDY